jgi:hypothetical protein
MKLVAREKNGHVRLGRESGSSRSAQNNLKFEISLMMIIMHQLARDGQGSA